MFFVLGYTYIVVISGIGEFRGGWVGILFFFFMAHFGRDVWGFERREEERKLWSLKVTYMRVFGSIGQPKKRWLKKDMIEGM